MIVGQPQFGLSGLPPDLVQLFEFGFITLGLTGSLLVAYSIAATEVDAHRTRVFGIWATASLLLAGYAFWLLVQPMEMRGVMLGNG
jgi:hypothetical protein